MFLTNLSQWRGHPLSFVRASMNPRRRKRRYDRSFRDDFVPGICRVSCDWAGPSQTTAANRKALQLCRQIERTLHLALGGLSDPVLNDLLVVEVRPFPDSTRLLVTVCSATGDALEPATVLQHVDRASGRMRESVAAAVHRKKLPELIFQVVERAET